MNVLIDSVCSAAQDVAPVPLIPCIAASPMALVRRFTGNDEAARGAYIYFEQHEVRGPGFGQDIPALLAALDDVRQALVRQMAGMEFFISMIPEHYLHRTSTPVPDIDEVPDFGKAFKAIGNLLDASPDIKNQCDVQIEVNTGRQFCGSPKTPYFRLSVIERIPAASGFGTEARVIDCNTLAGGRAISFDPSSDDAKAILRWYAGAANGLIQWTWRPASK